MPESQEYELARARLIAAALVWRKTVADAMAAGNAHYRVWADAHDLALIEAADAFNAVAWRPSVLIDEHPHPSIWERLRAAIAANPTPGEQLLVGAVLHAQAEPERRTEYAWACAGHTDDVPCLHVGPERWAREIRPGAGGAVYVREVTEWRPA